MNTDEFIPSSLRDFGKLAMGVSSEALDPDELSSGDSWREFGDS